MLASAQALPFSCNYLNRHQLFISLIFCFICLFNFPFVLAQDLLRSYHVLVFLFVLNVRRIFHSVKVKAKLYSSSYIQNSWKILSEAESNSRSFLKTVQSFLSMIFMLLPPVFRLSTFWWPFIESPTKRHLSPLALVFEMIEVNRIWNLRDSSLQDSCRGRRYSFSITWVTLSHVFSR